MKTYQELLIEVQKSLVSAQWMECARQNGYKFTKMLASPKDVIYFTEQKEPTVRSKTLCYLVYEFDEEQAKRLLYLLKAPTEVRISSPEWEEVQPQNRQKFDDTLLFWLFKPEWKKASQLKMLHSWETK